MRAFQYENPNDGLQLNEVAIPKPDPGHVQLQVKAAGICHSDCHLVAGHNDDWLTKKPTTLGHEVAGVVTAVGPDVTEYHIGDRVSVSLLGYPAENRTWSQCIGIGFDGGYAEYAVAPARRLVRIPDRVSFAQAAVATDALATSYHAAVIEAGAKPGITIGIIGLGGLGMSGLTFAILKGATVYGFDVVDAKLQDARELGAHSCFLSLEDAKDVAFDIIVDFAGTGSTTKAALKAVKSGGKVVVVGLGTKTISISASDLVLDGKTLVGSIGSSAEDLIKVLELLQDGLLNPLLVEVPFLDIPSSISLLAKGGVKGRCWANPSKLSV